METKLDWLNTNAKSGNLAILEVDGEFYQFWPDLTDQIVFDRISQNVAFYFRLLGENSATTFLQHFGGNSLAKEPLGSIATLSDVIALLGEGQSSPLVKHMENHNYVRIPHARAVVARQLRANGLNLSEICKSLSISRNQLSHYLRRVAASSLS